jgi:hypothetical protein
MKGVLLAGLLVAVASCYPGDVTSLSELDVVLTFQNPESDYAQLVTYSIPDTVVQIDEDSSEVAIDHSYDDDVVNKVRARLDGYGWTEVSFPADTPDVFVLASAVADEYTAYTYYPGYWWGYWGWYYPCYYCYPGYPGYVTVTQYDAGTLLIDMIETATISLGDSTTRFAWTAAVNGVLGSSSASTVQRALAGLDKAFNQSPYLEK